MAVHGRCGGAATRMLSPAGDGPIDMVALGTPHFGIGEFAALAVPARGRRIHSGLSLVVSTSHHRGTGGGAGSPRGDRGCRRAGDDRQLQLLRSAAHRLSRAGDDQCSQMGLRAGHDRRQRLFLELARVRRVGGARHGVARPGAVQGMAGSSERRRRRGRAHRPPARRSGAARESPGRSSADRSRREQLTEGCGARSALELLGGFDPKTGGIIDRRHPQSGINLAGRVVDARIAGLGDGAGIARRSDPARHRTGGDRAGHARSQSGDRRRSDGGLWPRATGGDGHGGSARCARRSASLPSRPMARSSHGL